MDDKLRTHLEDIFQSTAPEGEMTYFQMIKAFQELEIKMDSVHAAALFREKVERVRDRININTFKSIYEAFTCRREFADIFQKYCTTARLLPYKKLLEFLQKELQESCVNKQRVCELIHKYEKNPEARRKTCMTFDGFARFMNSQETHIFRRDRTQIYQDMNQPLTNYFISTSHNTYLLSHQLVGQSHPWAYSSALMRGCRCLEIDCWDGDDNEPIVYHGFTLTSKITFRSVVYVIEKYAFTVSQYPLVLSLEDHCSRRQQEVLAHYLITILGDKLLRAAITDPSSEVLPSPEALKGKILIKHKKTELAEVYSPTLGGQATGGRDEVEYDNEESEDVEPTRSHFKCRLDQLRYHLRSKQQIPSPALSEQKVRGTNEEESKIEESENEPARRDFGFRLVQLKKRLRSKQQEKCQEIVPELSDLVIYSKSKKFISFQDSQDNQKFYENNSLSEKAAQQFIRHSAQDFIYHNMNFLTRIYPKGWRTSSSNLQPLEFWNVGCQMVALNFQTPGVPMDLLDGRFRDNGGCGYVLKPDFLCESNSKFDPNNLPQHHQPFVLSITVISGFLLPPGKLANSNTANPAVTVEIYGVPADQCSMKTRVIKKNALNPYWNESFTFSIQVPELALVRFCLEDRIPLIGNEFVGQYTLPLSCISKGYRHIPLLNKHGQNLLPASLFVHIWYV